MRETKTYNRQSIWTFWILTWMLFPAIAVICGALSSCKSEDVVIEYDKTFEETQKLAIEKGKKAFCIVLSRPDCPPCVPYIEKLGRQYKYLCTKAIFNIVDVQLPEHQWYQQWACTGMLPTTCIFSTKGELLAIVPGTSGPSMQCIESVLSGKEAKCADYLYNKRYPVLGGDYQTLLTTLLSCKFDLDSGIDISPTIDDCVQQTHYPYPIYLKYLNEAAQGRYDQAAFWAQRLLEFDDTYYYLLYGDLYAQAKYIANPDYNPRDAAILTVESEVHLDNCKIHQPKRFALTLTNTGKTPLHIRNIEVGCSCLRLFNSKQLVLNAGEEQALDFEFTADTKGEIHRAITFFSDASNAITYVHIYGNVK